MIIFKFFFKIRAFLKLFFLKLIYGRKLFVGKNFTFRKGFSLVIDGENSKVKIGDNVFFNNYCTIAAMEEITIGDNTIFGENVKIYDHNHKFKDPQIPIKNQGFSHAKIEIGSNCWISSNVVILKGVRIGNHSVIGAGCIIYKDVPKNSLIILKQDVIVESILVTNQ